ncbi:MAG: heavy metal-binding domain-containing protein [Acidimicrobiales bacterium]
MAAEMRQAAGAVAQGSRHPGRAQASTSDLSIDEALLLHSVGWEALDLVCGVSMVSIPVGVWNWGAGEITWATQAETNAMTAAADRLRDECAKVGGAGVVGVEVAVKVRQHHAEVGLVGTAIRPAGQGNHLGRPFVSDLSGKDFALLDQAGWRPLGIAFGTSFVYAPRRSAGTAIRQKGLNVELTNFTEALYDARESAMERMQSSAIALGGDGVVAVQVQEGPMGFARHAIAFTAWGTAVKLGETGHHHVRPRVILSMDDSVLSFDAGALRGQ